MSIPADFADPELYPQDLELQLKRNRRDSGWFREQLDSFAEHIRSAAPYNQDQIARALTGIAEGREWQAMVWR